MKKIHIAMGAVLFATLGMSSAEEVKWSGGLKVWEAALAIHNDDGSVVTNSSRYAAGSASLTAKKDAYFVTASAQLPANYDFGTQGYMRRIDQDLAVGWNFFESYSVLLGQKKMSATPSNDVKQTIDASYVGLSGAKPILEQSFLYGTGIYSFKASDTPSATTKTNWAFASYEVGYGYALDQTTQLTVGYKLQTIGSLYQPTGARVTDHVSGVVIGMNFNFN